jgi:hypothetical protein
MHVRARPGNPPATWATGVHLCLVLLVTQSWCVTPMVSLVGAAVLPTSCLLMPCVRKAVPTAMLLNLLYKCVNLPVLCSVLWKTQYHQSYPARQFSLELP